MSAAPNTLAEKLRQAQPLPQELLDAMRDLTIPQQLAFARRQSGITQREIAATLGMKQGYYSRLEQSDKHLLIHYQRAAAVLGWRMSLFPKGTRAIFHGRRASGK